MDKPVSSNLRFGEAPKAERPLWQSIRRGLFCRCPSCGEGRLFKAFLKPVDSCAHCGEAMHHQRADDLPPYLVILVLGHVVIGGYMAQDQIMPLSLLATFALWTPVTIVVALLSIQPIKGAVIGLQWALRMHGFSGIEEQPEHP
ncbi:DUF983 domain-containing protein [Oryzifoliimicrobium ureilyticus]|uniref:DUF983 domain-containing protein n=1 Tax=Oryzifoliimicrobium ureilyticus TaxID=3113724 RepID=UPI00307626BA